jgi:hypothetical protein
MPQETVKWLKVWYELTYAIAAYLERNTGNDPDLTTAESGK